MEPVRVIPAQTLVIECACDFAAIAQACWDIRSFLTKAGLSEPELSKWWLALTEAGNNAVKHVNDSGRQFPVRFEIQVNRSAVEVRILDHTPPGFEFPKQAVLPADVLSEKGRGLYIIQKYTDFQSYERGAGQNCMILRKGRESCP